MAAQVIVQSHPFYLFISTVNRHIALENLSLFRAAARPSAVDICPVIWYGTAMEKKGNELPFPLRDWVFSRKEPAILCAATGWETED